MDLIPSFQIDHTRLLPGIYVSRIDSVGNDYVTTFDIRMKKPNIEPCVHQAAMHTIEHLAATYLRAEPEWKDKIVYWGPMGCLTGCYLIMKGRPAPRDILPLITKTFEFIAAYEGEIPGTKIAECGTCALHDLGMAKYEAKLYAEILRTKPGLEYPVSNN